MDNKLITYNSSNTNSINTVNNTKSSLNTSREKGIFNQRFNHSKNRLSNRTPSKNNNVDSDQGHNNTMIKEKNKVNLKSNNDFTFNDSKQLTKNVNLNCYHNTGNKNNINHNYDLTSIKSQHTLNTLNTINSNNTYNNLNKQPALKDIYDSIYSTKSNANNNCRYSSINRNNHCSSQSKYSSTNFNNINNIQNYKNFTTTNTLSANNTNNLNTINNMSDASTTQNYVKNENKDYIIANIELLNTLYKKRLQSLNDKLKSIPDIVLSDETLNQFKNSVHTYSFISDRVVEIIEKEYLCEKENMISSLQQEVLRLNSIIDLVSKSNIDKIELIANENNNINDDEVRYQYDNTYYNDESSGNNLKTKENTLTRNNTNVLNSPKSRNEFKSLEQFNNNNNMLQSSRSNIHSIIEKLYNDITYNSNSTIFLNYKTNESQKQIKQLLSNYLIIKEEINELIFQNKRNLKLLSSQKAKISQLEHDNITLSIENNKNSKIISVYEIDFAEFKEKNKEKTERINTLNTEISELLSINDFNKEKINDLIGENCYLKEKIYKEKNKIPLFDNNNLKINNYSFSLVSEVNEEKIEKYIEYSFGCFLKQILEQALEISSFMSGLFFKNDLKIKEMLDIQINSKIHMVINQITSKESLLNSSYTYNYSNDYSSFNSITIKCFNKVSDSYSGNIISYIENDFKCLVKNILLEVNNKYEEDRRNYTIHKSSFYAYPNLNKYYKDSKHRVFCNKEVDLLFENKYASIELNKHNSIVRELHSHINNSKNKEKNFHIKLKAVLNELKTMKLNNQQLKSQVDAVKINYIEYSEQKLFNILNKVIKIESTCNKALLNNEKELEKQVEIHKKKLNSEISYFETSFFEQCNINQKLDKENKQIINNNERLLNEISELKEKYDSLVKLNEIKTITSNCNVTSNENRSNINISNEEDMISKFIVAKEIEKLKVCYEQKIKLINDKNKKLEKRIEHILLLSTNTNTPNNSGAKKIENIKEEKNEIKKSKYN